MSDNQDTLRQWVEAELAQIEADERVHYAPAKIQINAPLALIQIELKTRRQALREIEARLPELAAGEVEARGLEALALGVLEAAVAWWRGHRPVDWTHADHLDNPTINAHATDSDRELAAAVGKWAAELGEPIP